MLSSGGSGGLSAPFVGISYKGFNYSFLGKNTLSKKKNGEGDNIVEFDALELEEGEEGTKPSQMEVLLSTLKEKLEPKDYSELMTKLGIDEDISNAELLEAITALLAKKEKPEGEEGEEEEEKDAADYKTFIKECMAEGKDLKTCSAEFKEKYPDPDKQPSKEEIAEVEQLVSDELAGKTEGGEESDLAKRFKDLETKFAALEKKDELSGVSTKVEELVKDKHLAPVQRDLVIKLADGLAPEKQEDLLNLFRNTQKFSTHQDAGVLESQALGAGGAVMTVERKKELIELHNLGGLINDKADRSKKLPWEDNN